MRSIVVGSGISGLSVALLLARQRQEVLVLEAGPRPAPLLQGFTRNGLHFDTGFHYGGGLHQGGVLRRWLQALRLWRHLRWQPQPRGDLFCFGQGQEIRLPSGNEAVVAAVEAHFPGHGAGMQDMLTLCDEVLHHSPYTNPALNENTVPWRGQSRTLTSMLAQWNFPPVLEALLRARCLLYGTPPSLASWEDYALVAGPYFQSTGTWLGGGPALVRAFERELAACGVVVRCRARVSALEAVPGQGVRGLHLDHGERLACDHCYFTGHPGQLQHLLPPGLLRPAWFHRIQDTPETAPALMLFAETEALPPGYNAYLLPHPGQVAAERNSTEETTSLHDAVMNPLVLLPHATEKSGSAAPGIYMSCGQGDGRRVPLMVLAFLRPQDLPAEASGPVYQDFKARAVAQLSELVEQRCPALGKDSNGYPRWRVLDAATPHSMRRWIFGSSGSLYGLRHDTENLPLLPLTKLPGLFLAGQNIVLPGVLGGIVSAALAVGFAHGHGAALSEFRACAHNE